jgi:hypothetical protein
VNDSPRSRQCPRCYGEGRIYRPLLCVCGHQRSDHIADVGCVGFSGTCEDDCPRFRKDPDQDSDATLARLRDDESYAADRAIEGRWAS